MCGGNIIKSNIALMQCRIFKIDTGLKTKLEWMVEKGHFFNMATIQENVTLLHSTALAMNAVRM